MVMMISKLVMMVKTIMMLKMGLMMMMMMMMAVRFVQIYINVPRGGYRGVLRISSDGDDRMGTKIKTQKIPLGFLQNLPKSLDQKSHAESLRALDETTTPNIVAPIMLRVVASLLQWYANGATTPTTRNNMQQGEQTEATCNILKNVGSCFYLLASNVASVCTLLGAFEMTSNKFSAKK